MACANDNPTIITFHLPSGHYAKVDLQHRDQIPGYWHDMKKEAGVLIDQGCCVFVTMTATKEEKT